MDEMLKLAVAGIGGTGGGAILMYVISTLMKEREKKRDAAEARVEQVKDATINSLSAKIDRLSDQVTQIQSDSRIAADRSLGTKATMDEFRTRMDGMSASYGKSIEEIKFSLGRLEMDFKRLESDVKRLESTLHDLASDLKKSRE